MTLNELAKQLYAHEKRTDTSLFQRRARVLQSMWREEQGYDIGLHKTKKASRPLGSRLPMPMAEETLVNYLTPTIRQVVRDEVMDDQKSKGKLYKKPRIYDDLLSSQPLAFNLFGELQRDLDLCSRLIAGMSDNRFSQVERVEFEYSPGRSDPRFTCDRSAFDVFIMCRTSNDEPAFLGIEVKYHENLKNKAATHRRRYDEVADAMGCFDDTCRTSLRKKPLQQIWRDHLLAGSLLQSDAGYADGQFVFLYPKDNLDCAHTVNVYRQCLTNESTFAAWTLEAVVEELNRHSDAKWINLFYDRYLAFDRVDEKLKE